jgi:hypothetical protein
MWQDLMFASENIVSGSQLYYICYKKNHLCVCVLLEFELRAFTLSHQIKGFFFFFFFLIGSLWREGKKRYEDREISFFVYKSTDVLRMEWRTSCFRNLTFPSLGLCLRKI